VLTERGGEEDGGKARIHGTFTAPTSTSKNLLFKLFLTFQTTLTTLRYRAKSKKQFLYKWSKENELHRNSGLQTNSLIFYVTYLRK
jgi:hypothetical protein